MYYYDDTYDEDEYNYEDDYPKGPDGDFENPDVHNYIKFPLVTPPKVASTSTLPIKTTTRTTTERTTEQTRRSTLNRNSYNPGAYNKYENSNDFENQRPRPYKPETSKSTPQSSNVACNSPQMLKQFLKSGAHGNDPRKIQAMIKKCQMDKAESQDAKHHSGTNEEEDEETNAQSIFEKYSLKSSKSKSNANKDRNDVHKNNLSYETESKLPPKAFLPPGYNEFESSKKNSNPKDGNKNLGNNDARSTNHDEEEYDDDDYYDEDYEDKESDSLSSFKPYGGIARPKGISSSSNLFRKFIKNNVGKTVRRPLPSNDEESKVASDIFKKYSSVNLKRPKGSYNKVRMSN